MSPPISIYSSNTLISPTRAAWKNLSSVIGIDVVVVDDDVDDDDDDDVVVVVADDVLDIVVIDNNNSNTTNKYLTRFISKLIIIYKYNHW